MPDVTAVGELLIDFTPAGFGADGAMLFSRQPGGAPANVLAMIAKLGAKAAFIGKVGEDSFGHFLKETLTGAGIDASGVVFDKEIHTTLAFVHLDSKGDRSFSFCRNPGADLMLAKDDVNQELVDGCGMLHFGSLSFTSEPCRSTVLELVSNARHAGKVISFDPNYRKLLWKSEEEAKAQIENALPLADILKVSEEEMTLLTKETDVLTGAAELSKKGPSIVLVTMGAEGAAYSCLNGSGTVKPFPVKTIDTTGAGDAFMGAMLHQLKGKTKEELANITESELRNAIEFANKAGALATTKHGGIPAMPTLEEINALGQ
ncbi:MAG: carbohydrate kinase [Clostridiales bacterium]|nr:carbohydrate kinase [Clostridiales bacterium]